MFTLMQQMIESLRVEINLLKKQNAQLLDLLSEKSTVSDRQTDRQTDRQITLKEVYLN